MLNKSAQDMSDFKIFWANARVKELKLLVDLQGHIKLLIQGLMLSSNTGMRPSKDQELMISQR